MGIYIPYFTGMNIQEIMVVIIIFAMGVYVLCKLAKGLAAIASIGERVERYEKIIVPVVFIGLGLYILLENGTLQYLWSVIY